MHYTEVSVTRQARNAFDAAFLRTGLSGKDFANKLKCSPGSISQYRNGLIPPANRQRDIAKLLSRLLGEPMKRTDLWGS